MYNHFDSRMQAQKGNKGEFFPLSDQQSRYSAKTNMNNHSINPKQQQYQRGGAKNMTSH